MNKYCFAVILGLVLILNILISPAAAAEGKLVVALNQSRVLNFAGVERVAIANPDIADVMVVSSSEVLLIGKGNGVTTLHVWADGTRFSYLVEVSPDDVPLANEIKNILGYPDIRVSKIGKTVILEGTVNDQYQKARAEKVAGAYADKVVNLLELTRPTQIKIEAKIIEINREKIKNLGIQWGNGGTSSEAFSPGGFFLGQSAANSVVSGNVLGGLGTYSDINAQLNALIKDSLARVLSQPNIVTLSGDKASIMVGGQIPVPVSDQNGQITVEWKDYGIKLNIEPEVNAEGLIHSKVTAEVSSMDWNSPYKIPISKDLSIPPIKMRKAETAIALSSGQTMAIGGLIASDMTKDMYKVPLLGDLPILGQLFRSTSFDRNETELLILLTPTIIDPATYVPQATQKMKDSLTADPWGGTKSGGQNQDTHRG
ncbi:bacterial general secretion pathway protein d signature [Lucifera butyrica]|uniref:Bacterial general secretion pathway protein d signature n=1 Tax=Lucifera butyrica TaxID=1351585 RepID=A0A498RGG9_9FIRM|nr:pilus assembly protein N-terminal domain-containing protein [Lucifera butyrica]VBB09900.1 bacterial general secretion pathway protein d signature [Lucifera butyrica]